jgi:tRNA(fMet)-specific endonuclease VapC
VALRLCLDTSAYSALMRGEAAVVEPVRRAQELLLSAVVVGELLYGFRCGSRLERNVAELETFLESPFVTVLPVTRRTADRYARVAESLRKKGTPIPSNDVWIAAGALESGAELLSYDTHFTRIEGLVTRIAAG